MEQTEERQEMLTVMAHVLKSTGGALRAVMKEEALTKNEMEVLLCLFSGYDSPSAIARVQGVSRSMVSRSVDALVKRDFVRIRRDEKDRRQVRLELGEQGRGAAVHLDAARQDYLCWLYEGITPEEKSAFEGIMRKMAARVRQSYDGKGGSRV